MNKDDRKETESKVKTATEALSGDFKGTYHSLNSIPDAKKIIMNSEENLLAEPQGAIELVASGSIRDWPANRGVFSADSGQFFVWVNEEDHMRMISSQKGGDMKSVLTNLDLGCKQLESIGFQSDEHYG
mmetsp:Transcript_57110/g.48221  ORF Transcript_57110/g.48221 Transcript_57110/m.48221 type:complete len:129 (+) Transcript_57110:2398-2784(+)